MIYSINKNLKKILEVEEEMGLPTGIEALDEAIHGYQRGKLITVAAVSGCGKTSFMVDGIISAAQHVPVGVFSLEMGTRAVVDRMVYNIAGLNYHRCKKHRNKTEQALVDAAKAELEQYKDIYFAEEVDCMYPKFTLQNNKPSDSIELATKEMVDKGVGIFFLDYIQQIRWGFKAESETLRLKEISGGLHSLALKYNVPFVVMCQLTKEAANRATKKDANPCPTISDIRDGGFIINDSDIILLLYRPNMVANTSNKIDLFGDTTEDAQIIVGKGRNGPNGAIDVQFLNYCMSFRPRKKPAEELF